MHSKKQTICTSCLAFEKEQNCTMITDYTEITALLNDRVKRYNNPDFIQTDPIQIPHRFCKKEDIEIAGFLAATIAWGQRKSIIKNANQLMDLLDNSPYEFITQSSEREKEIVSSFVHRTFNGNDCMFFLASLQNIYRHHGGLEQVFNQGYLTDRSIYGALKHFRTIFLELPHNKHANKHLSDVTANSSAKRLNMFLRWMVRTDDMGVDFGLWKTIPPSALMLPLDVHTGDVARALGILSRKQNDWKAVEEITAVLRGYDTADPIKYDFALFGIGAFENKKEILI
ncbi:MAG: hypothetical protein H6Q20_2459 [Bacteroidetes bacterium]|nr:hypothetical protein [Bacteroidota bacterium]